MGSPLTPLEQMRIKLGKANDELAPPACPERPAEPVIDEAAVEQRARVLQAHGPDEYPYGFYLHMAREELRSNACGSESVGSSSDSSSTKSSAGQSATPAAPAADPRRLTETEIASAFNKVSPVYGAPFDAVRAVADAQLAKARVTISEAEIREKFDDPLTVFSTQGAIDWLRRHRVEVTP